MMCGIRTHPRHSIIAASPSTADWYTLERKYRFSKTFLGIRKTHNIALPDGELAIVPGTSHGLLVEKPDICNKILLDFLTLEPVPTLAPRRRA